MEATGNIIKAETRLNVINNLKRDERSQGKHLLKMIEQIDGIQEKLELCRQRQVELYCNYVTQVMSSFVNEIDFLKGHSSTMFATKDLRDLAIIRLATMQVLDQICLTLKTNGSYLHSGCDIKH